MTNIQLTAKLMLNELKRNKLEVVLIPAPDPKHVDHKIRVAVSRPPAWYSSLYHEGYTNRESVYKSLQKIIDNEPLSNTTDVCIYEIVHHSQKAYLPDLDTVPGNTLGKTPLGRDDTEEYLKNNV